MTTDPSLGPPTSHHHALELYTQQLDATHAKAERLAAELDRDQINWAPDPNKWSIAQCLDHLAVVNEKYGRRLERGIAESRNKGLTLEKDSSAPRYGFFERFFERSMEPPPRRRFKAPAAVVPPSDHDPDTVRQRFLASNRRLAELAAAAQGLDLVRSKINSPLAKWLKLRLGAAFAILTAHERRHLWQAEQVRQAEGFPAEGR